LRARSQRDATSASFSLWIPLGLVGVVAGSAVADGGRRVGVWATVLFSGAIVAWLLPVFRGNHWCEQALQRRGCSRLAQLAAATEAEAIERALREHAAQVR
jgi:hypothetical protein